MSSGENLKNHNNVITLKPKDSPTWKVFDWTDSGNNPVEDWRNSLSEDGKELFDDLLKSNRKIDNPSHWVGFKRFMKGKLAPEKIFEFKFVADGKQHRVLCKCGDIRKSLIILMGCYHKDSYTPQDALDTAVKRSKAIGKKGIELIERPIREDF
jgi:hypothetical protein